MKNYLFILSVILLVQVFVASATNNATNLTKQEKEDNEQFGKPIYGKKHVKQEHSFYHHATGAKSVLKYEVEHHDNVVHFRLEKYGIVNAKCNKGEMLLKFNSHEKMLKFIELLNEKDENKVLTGGCLDLKTLDVVGVASKVIDFKARTESTKFKTIIVKVQNANFEEVFANAKVEANLQPGFAEAFKGHHKEHHRRLSQHRRDLWGVGDDNQDKPEDCKDGEPDCNVNFGKKYTFNGFRKDYNGKSLRSFGPVDVTCDTCSVAFTPSITFGLHVAFVKLKHVLLTVNGNLQTTVRVSAKGSVNGQSSNEKLIAHFDAPPVIFSIGAFPVKLKVSVPVNAGYTASFGATGEVSTGISGSVRASGGVEFINGKFSRIGSFNPTYSAVTPTITAHANFNGEAYLEPKISMDINNVVRGYLNARVAVQFEGEARGSYSYGQSGNGVVGCSVTSTVTASIGGELGLNVKGKNIGPRKSLGEKQILDVSRKLWSGSKQIGGGSSFDTMDDEGIFYDENTDMDNTFNVRDSSYLTLDVAEEDRVDNGVSVGGGKVYGEYNKGPYKAGGEWNFDTTTDDSGLCSTERYKNGLLNRPNGIRRDANPFSHANSGYYVYVDEKKCTQKVFDGCCSICTGPTLYDYCWAKCASKPENHDYSACSLRPNNQRPVVYRI